MFIEIYCVTILMLKKITFSYQRSINRIYLVMPIGVPKVPFRLPGEEDAVWIDV